MGGPVPSVKPGRGALPNNSVAVVMPVRADMDSFKLAFYSVVSFTDYPFAFTVVANMPAGHALKVLKSSASNNGVGVVDYSEINRAASINLALRQLFLREGVNFGCVLSPDVVVEKGWLRRLVETLADHPTAGIVAPTLPVGCLSQAHGMAPAVEEVPMVQDVFLFRRQTYLAVDGFDELLHGGFEDMDFCEKVRARGERILVDGHNYVHRLRHADTEQFAGAEDRAISEAIFEKRYPRRREPAAISAAK